MSSLRVKICGLTRKDDVDAAVAHGAWAVGFVLWPGSPRAVATSRVRELIADVPASVRRVGVVVNATREEVGPLADAGLTTVQLHGNEDASQFLDLGLEVIKAASLEDDPSTIAAAEIHEAVTVLVDAHDPVRHGGTGERADWRRAAALSLRRPVILAGGLRAGNIRDAISVVAPWGVDVSSGVESAPGIKDVAKMKAFFAALGANGEGYRA